MTDEAQRDVTEAGPEPGVAHIALALAAGAALLYALRAAPTAYLLDSSELVATTSALAISHPPGHPAYHLLGFAPSLAPFGTAALRSHLWGAGLVALVVALLPLIAARLGWLRTRAQAFAAGIVAAGVAFTNGLLFQAIRAEVYGLHALLVIAAFALLARRPGEHVARREVALVALLLGIGLANHHYLIVFALPAFAFGVLAGSPTGQRVRNVLTGCAFGVLPLLAYAYLPLRGLARPAIGWGWPVSGSEIYWHVSAQAFQKTAGNAVGLDVGAGLTNVLGVLADQFTIVGVFVALGAFVLLALRDRRTAVLFGLAIGFNLLTQTLFAFDPMNPDVLGYFATTNALVGLLLIYAVTEVGAAAKSPTVAEGIATALAFLIAIGMAWSASQGVRTWTLARTWDADALRDSLWRDAAPEPLVVTAYFETQFNAWYGQAVEDRRPDALHVHRGFRTYPFYDAMIGELDERVAPLLTPPAGSGLLDEPALFAWAGRAPVLVEPEVLLEPGVLPRALPERLVLRVVPNELPTGPLPVGLRSAHLEQLAALQASLHEPVELQTRRNLLWSTFQLATRLCDAGRLSHCRTVAGAAAELAPGDPDVAALVDHAGGR